MRKEVNAMKTKPEETEIAEEDWKQLAKNEKQAEDRNPQEVPS